MATTPIPVKSATVGLPGILEVGHSWGLDGGTLEGWTGGTLGGWTATHPGSRVVALKENCPLTVSSHHPKIGAVFKTEGLENRYTIQYPTIIQTEVEIQFCAVCAILCRSVRDIMVAAIEDKELAIWFPTLATAPTKIIRKELGQWVDDTDNEEKLTT